MDLKKIQLTKQNTLNVVYSNENGDTVSVTGANIVHQDLKEALRNLVPHLTLLSEQREGYNNTLEELEQQREWEEKSIYTRMAVNAVALNADEVSICGTRILERGDIIRISTPKISTVDDENYGYKSELSLALDNLKYEAEQYIVERKWALKQGELDFDEAGDPFAEIEAGDVPSVHVEMKTKGHTTTCEKVRVS